MPSVLRTLCLPRGRRACKPAAWRRLAAAMLLLAAGAALAQKIDDVPPMVQNNVPPNFMFMIDSSGSMSNIVPAAPYSASGNYASSKCTSTTLIPEGTEVDVRVANGQPRILYGGVVYRHATASTTGREPPRCFIDNGRYTARLLADGGTSSSRQPGSYLGSEYSGHFLNWYFGDFGGSLSGWTDRKLVSSGAVQTRMEIARAAAKSTIDALPVPSVSPGSATVRVGLSSYATGGGSLRVAMGDLTAASRATLKSSIDGITPSGMTPLASTFADIGRYMATGFTGSVQTTRTGKVDLDALLRLDGTDNAARNACLANAPSCTSTSSPRPIQYWCQRSYLFAMTDGRPQSDRSFNKNPHVRDYDGDCSGSLAGSCVGGGNADSWDRKTNRSYESAGSDYMDDVAKLLFDLDLRPDLTKPAAVPPNEPARNNLTTYMIGFADPAVQDDPLLANTARQGGGRFIAASDGPALVSAFKTIIADALSRDASSAAVAVTSAQIKAGSTGYASSYNSGSWYGDLQAYSLDLATGLPSGGTQWSAREKLEAQTALTRRIASYNAGSGRGAAFTTANGASFRLAASSLSDAVINYTRGDRAGEGSTFRTRPFLLGDIVNAEPVVVNYASGPVVFQAANDGMLHAFDGRTGSAATTAGQELWAYVPQLVHDKLAERASPSVEHRYLVDATPATAAVSNLGSISRLLVGGLGKGGAGYYALDISSGSAASQADAVNKVLWEFKAGSGMGYSFGTPRIVNTAEGWRVVVASGYGNDGSGVGGDGAGRVWVLDAATGREQKVLALPAGFGSSSGAIGLAHLGNLGGNGTDMPVQYLYGGDLQGNLWRFNLAPRPGEKAVVRIAVVSDPAGRPQPITVPPLVARVPGSSTRVYVYFGTGRYFSTDDVPGTPGANSQASQVQTLYGIIDDTSEAEPPLPDIRGSNGADCPTGGGKGELLCQKLTRDGNAFTATHNELDLASRRGFYVDIPIQGGRVHVEAALSAQGTLVFVVNQPSAKTCEPGGSGYLVMLNARTGGAIRSREGYHGAGGLIGDAVFSRPVLITTSDGLRALLRGSNNSIANPEIKEAPGTQTRFRRAYKRALN